MESGAELDLAVSAALNIYYDKRRVEDCPRYSVDLNAAFSAAEKVGLFEHYGIPHFNHLALMCWRSNWRVFMADAGKYEVDLYAEEATPALAICAAILKLKEQSDAKA